MPSSFFCSCPAFFLLRPALFYTQAFAHWSCKPVPDPCLDNCPPAAEIQSHDLTLPGISPKMYFTRNVLHQRYRSHRSTLCCSNIATTFLLCDWSVWVWHTFMFVHPCIMHNFAEMFWCILLHLCTCAVQIISGSTFYIVQAQYAVCISEVASSMLIQHDKGSEFWWLQTFKLRGKNHTKAVATRVL